MSQNGSNGQEKGDQRKVYVLRVASYLLGLNISEDKLKNVQPLESFVDSNINLLVFTRSEQKVDLSNKMKSSLPTNNVLRVVFYKTQSIPLNNDNYKSVVNVISANGALNQVFLKSVQNVFGKELSEGNNKQLIAAVNELEESLLASVDVSDSGGGGGDSLQDEIRGWKSKSGSAADEYTSAFKQLQLLIDTLQERNIDELSELVESCEETCDELWNCSHPYPQSKMKVLLESMASYLCDQITSKIDEKTIWRDEKTSEKLRVGIDLCDQLMFSVKLLTSQTWKRHVEHQWEGNELEIKFLQAFRDRLDEILSLASLGSQLEELLQERGVREETEKTIETAMRGMAPLAYNPFTEPNWKSRLLVAERSIESTIDRTLPILKQRLAPSSGDAQNIVISLEKLKSFLCRANIKEKLQHERETFLSRLISILSTKNQEFEEKINQVDIKNFQFLTEVAAKIVWIRQQTTQMESIRSLSKLMLNDLPNYSSFSTKLNEFIDRLNYAEKECFDDWSRETISLIEDKNDSIALETTGKIMILESSNRELNVNYSDRLLRLLKEVRQLSSLGFNIPSKIMTCCNNGEKYYRYGVILKQIAHFYNTIDQQMIPSQQSLMLDEAIAFEKLVIPRKDASNSASKVTWNEPKQLEEFIQQLQTAEQKLSNRNRRLRNVHMELIEMVEKLMDLNIVKQNADWKDIILKIRTKMKEEELVHGAARKNMKPWLIHWDFQLYKALLIQYEWGIESIQSQLSTIAVNLVFVDQKIQLRPTIEEIRSKYYKELSKFLRIPDKFKGVQDDESSTKFYSQMIDRSMNLLPTIYEKAEQLIEKVEACDQAFSDWLVISQVDLEELIEENLKTAADWESQFKILKTKAREAERLPHELKFECILVSTAGIKAAIEDAIQRLFDTLTWTLRHSISTTSQSINTFLSQAIDVLSTRPQSIDEIAEANAKHSIFAETNKQLKQEWKVMEEQYTLLRSVAGQGVEQIDNLEQNWDRFELMLDSHQLMIKDQVDVLKTNVETSIKGMKDEAEKLKARWDQFKPRTDALQGDRDEMIKAIQFIKEKRQQWQELADGREKIEKESGQFGLDPPKLEIIDEIDEDIKLFEDNWLIYELFNTEIDSLAQEEWIVFRSKTYLFDEFLQKWAEKLKGSNQTHMSVRLMKDVEHFKELSSALKFCRGDVLSADHWHEMFRFLGLPRGTTIEKLKFVDLLGVSQSIVENVDQLKQLNSRAQGEVAIRDAIQELTLWAAQTEFTLADYKHSNGQNLKIIKEWKESINTLKDSQALLQSLKSSPYYSQFTDKTAVWETRLADLDIYLAQMNEIQRKWIYLEPIFGRGALPSEASRFSRVDSEYRAILNDVSKDARLVSLCSRQSLKKSLEQIVDQLNRCQKALNQFLEQKRNAFPRFYFIGDDDLLEILGQSTNPQVIQSHMKKLFQGIDKVIFSSNGETISSIVSAEGETVALSKPVRIVPQVELWLQQISDEMRKTLKDLGAQAVNDPQASLAKYPSQILCLAEEVKFSASVESILNSSKDLNSFKSQLQEKLKTYTNMKVDDKVSDLKLKSLILDLIHHIDVVDQLLDNKANSINCWTWQRQLRFYQIAGGAVVLRQVSSEFEYTYEYQGNYSKLVHTPLTDKCYLTLTQAMYMGLGGNPYGPAGTGKTESVKALAALMGRQVLVFNCDEGIDVTSMGRIFTGIVECGAWGCFDEFNRLDSTVLSAVSMQIQTIQGAIKAKTGSCTFGNKTVQVNPNSAIFVTLNPAGKGYGGRQKMPDNLKQLFRAVVMGKPDNELIASTILYSEGFVDATSLARKIVSVFQLSRQMLSKQQHYDWGLRALKVVLGGCGALRRAQQSKNETDLVVQALLLNTLSKLTFSDSQRFNSLIDDIFSKPNKEMAKFENLIEPLNEAAKEMNIKLSEKQFEKVFQLYEQMRQRIGVVVVGEAGSGKSTIWKVLHRALILSKTSLRVTTFNPKAVNRNKLLGNMDMDTREWSDGIITMAAREVIKDTSVHHWIVCDGDIDPEWVEALNSVLDDNRLLTMPSGERIQFGSNVNFVFETDSLKFASPATVSRMGMIYISEEDVSPKDVIKSWLTSNSEELHAEMTTWMDEQFWKAYKYARTNQLPGITHFALLRNGLTHLRASKSKTQFLVFLFNGFAPYILSDKRADFAKNVVFQGMPLSDPSNICYDDRVDSLMTYTDDVSQSVTKEEVEREDIRPFVLTADAQRYSDIVASWLNSDNRESFVITGSTGCGKQQLLKHCYQNDPNSQLATLYCSAQSSSSHLLQLIQQNCVQASNPTGRVWKPKDRPNLILFLKSINLPAPDKYGTNELLALLHQLLTYQGFFDHNLEWVSIENIQFVGSMNLIGESANNIPPRLLSYLRCISLNKTDDSQLTSIYRTYLTPIMEESGGGNAEVIASRMVDVYNKVQGSFKQSDNIVYSFSPRDLTNWVISLLRHEIEASRFESILCFEARRIFADRLPSETEKLKFDEILRNIIPHSTSNDKVNVTTGTIVPGENNIGLPLTPINLTDFSQLLLKSINRFEFEVANFSSLLTTQLTHLCAQVDRVLTAPSGHLFLPGRTGYGRRDAVRLIAHMHNITVFSPTVTANFSSKQFDNEMKNAITHAVTNTEHVILIFEDQQLRKNIFLQAVNSLLASGHVPGLFTQQETDGLVAQISEAASQAAFTGALQQFLAHRIRSLVHVVLIMDVEADDFKVNITENPSILKHCNIIYSDRLERSSLNEIPKLYLEREKIEATDVVLSGFVDVLVTLPEYVSLQPIKYRQFVENYAKMCEYKKSTLTVRLNRLQGGVSKLNEASEEVAKMQKKAAKKSKLLAEKQAEADEALKAITESMSGAEDQKLSMEQLKEATEKENVRIEEKKAKIDEQLKEVQPMIDAARKAVGSIKSESLSEIRSLRAPPEAVRDILQAVLLFMGILDTSWEAMRKFLSKSGVKEDIMNFDANRITNDIHKKVTALVKSKPNSFEEATAKRASVAAAPLAAWVKANLEYSKILEKISPLENEKNKLVKNLKKAEKQMENLSKGLQSVDEVVGDLKKKFEDLMKEATQIKVDLEREQATISIAGTLVESLSGEFQRWKAQIETLGEEQSKMEMCSLITAAFITYLGGCSEKERNTLLKAMCKMFNMNTFKPLSFASLETEQLNWKTKGLPADNLSLENAMIMFNTNHVPLLIDPSGQVPLFLAKYLEKSETFKAAQSDLMTQIELAIRFGKTIIIDDVVEFDAALIPILRKDLSSQGPRQVISFGGKQIDYNPDFRIFICTRDDKVRIRPNANNLLNIVNFTTTISALSAQLLDIAIHLEKPELEERSSSLLRDAELKKLELEKLEQLLLQQLASSQGNLLENTALLDSLNKSKESAEVISKSINESEQLHKELTAQKEIYVPLSHFASSLFFSFSNLQYYNNMYNYSVNTIMRLFEKTIRTCQDKTSTRVETLARQIQLTVFYHISRGIFRQDRLMFAIEFINATMPKLFQPKEWDLFTGVLVDESADSNASSKFSWVSQERISAVSKIRTHLPSLFNALRFEDEASWKEFSITLQCENSFPGSIDNKITPFQKVLVVQAVRPDRLYNCLMDFVLKTLNISSINPPAFALKEIFEESEASEPILFILADGADPSQELAELASSMRVSYQSISMGQGQEIIAYEAIKECAEKGEWLCLNNLHLMLAAVPFILKHLSLTTPNENFRLWLTTEADYRFPSMMLQQSLKITFEPPPGVRNNLLRTYSQIDKAQRSVITCQSIFVLAWLHALLQERRTFIPQGWTKFYEFGASDVRVARAFVEQLTATKSDWEFVRGILKFVIYGGRLENDFDGKVLDSYMSVLFNDDKINGRPGQQLVKAIDLPAGSNIDEYVAHISKNIPAVDEPYLFGLPENIKYSWQIVESDRTISSIRTLALGDSKNALKDSRESIEQIVGLWRKLCTSGGDLHKKAIPEATRSDDPIIEVLSLESINSLQILQSIHNSLKYVSMGSKNPALAPATTQKVIQSLVFQQTPDEWDSIWAGPSDPADYLNAVIRKTKGTLQLLETAKSTSILSQPIDFSDLFYPNIFLNALRQTTSRQLNVPMDQLQLCSAWESAALPAKQTVQVKGLLVQGATFDGFLRETTVSSSAYVQAPTLYLAWTAEATSTVKGEQVQIPLYTSNDRADLIGTVNMPCRGIDSWNIAAVALFLK